jgi:lipopolysaccharide/colanic/teichoic acid biosynthesis glycosyltransferase
MPEQSSARRAKRVIDVVGAAGLLVLLSPLLALLAVVVRIDSPGPAFFIQPRIGENGRRFQMYKFRTMCADAEQRLGELAHLNAGGNQLIRIRNDPRVTRFGSLLRRASLDELPQLINVVRGEMSLVGPRPQSPSEVRLYSVSQRRRLEMRPGITGLWQVTARDDPSFDRWITFDLDYIDHWSLALDLEILLKTPAVMLRTVNRSTGDLD